MSELQVLQQLLQKAQFESQLVLIEVFGILMLLIPLAFHQFGKMHPTEHRDRWPLAGALLIIAVVLVVDVIRFHIHCFGVGSDISLHNDCDPVGLMKGLMKANIGVLFLVVCLTGGLAKSFYAPVLILTPTIVLRVYPKPEQGFTEILVGAVALCIFFAALINMLDWDEKVKDKWKLNPTTAHSFYAFYLMFVTMLGLAMTFTGVFTRLA